MSTEAYAQSLVPQIQVILLYNDSANIQKT